MTAAFLAALFVCAFAGARDPVWLSPAGAKYAMSPALTRGRVVPSPAGVEVVQDGAWTLTDCAGTFHRDEQGRVSHWAEYLRIRTFDDIGEHYVKTLATADDRTQLFEVCLGTPFMADHLFYDVSSVSYRQRGGAPKVSGLAFFIFDGRQVLTMSLAGQPTDPACRPSYLCHEGLYNPVLIDAATPGHYWVFAREDSDAGSTLLRWEMDGIQPSLDGVPREEVHAPFGNLEDVAWEQSHRILWGLEFINWNGSMKARWELLFSEDGGLHWYQYGRSYGDGRWGMEPAFLKTPDGYLVTGSDNLPLGIVWTASTDDPGDGSVPDVATWRQRLWVSDFSRLPLSLQHDSNLPTPRTVKRVRPRRK